MLLWIRICLWLDRVKEFCIKYWKSLVAGFLLLVGYVLGRKSVSNNTNAEIKLKLVDAESELESIKQQSLDETRLKNEHKELSENNLKNKLEKINDIEAVKKKNIKELSNDDKKLDKILKEEHNLKKG